MKQEEEINSLKKTLNIPTKKDLEKMTENEKKTIIFELNKEICNLQTEIKNLKESLKIFSEKMNFLKVEIANYKKQKSKEAEQAKKDLNKHLKEIETKISINNNKINRLINEIEVKKHIIYFYNGGELSFAYNEDGEVEIF